jgi:hypothetical protein
VFFEPQEMPQFIIYNKRKFCVKHKQVQSGKIYKARDIPGMTNLEIAIVKGFSISLYGIINFKRLAFIIMELPLLCLAVTLAVTRDL